MELNERLRELRKEQGETQKQVAAAIGIGERPYQYLESGEHRPSLDTLIALADHFGVSLERRLSGCKDAFDQLLFLRVPLRYALPWRS